jgi:acyl-homoserine-lactone acylase
VACCSTVCLAADTKSESRRYQEEAQRVTIVRDDWGIAHVHGKTDADAVFGMVYAQAEDDFNRIETNYLTSLGRMAEAEGAKALYQDLRMRLFINPASLQREYAASPAWLRKLMDAFADGLNFYLATHPNVHPKVIRHFEPWMALCFTEGSIGGDYEAVELAELESFYRGQSDNSTALPKTAANRRQEQDELLKEPSGSNGMAIAPQNTAHHHSLLLINPHTSFFFRSELQMTSDEGLNAYGAVTWGQFFIYQGFNDHVGWMHTSSQADAIDEYLETVSKRGNTFAYKYGNSARPVQSERVTLAYKEGSGLAKRTFTVYRTNHGPVIGERDGKWLTIRLMQEHVKALTQSYSRTKAHDYASFRQTMELHTNSSNNTIFADSQGDIAYFHGNFIPRREARFDWKDPVDGSNPATEWHGLLSFDQTPHLLNPASGWLYNSNNWPWSAAGASSPKKKDFPAYVDNGTETARGLHALRVLQSKKDFTLQSLLSAAYDSYLPWFAETVPALTKAWDSLPSGNKLKGELAEQIAMLKAWNFRWRTRSVPTALAVFWGEDIRGKQLPLAKKQHVLVEDLIAQKTSGEELLQSLKAASERLTADFGTWKTPWGEINRFQRLTGDIVQPFNDGKPSIPVGFTSSVWGSLASFGAKPYPGTKKWYGTSGNSFVAAVEFGDRVHALAVTAGGESGHPDSRHFNDQAQRYATGNLREVYFYAEQLKGHTERTYRPGE